MKHVCGLCDFLWPAMFGGLAGFLNEFVSPSGLWDLAFFNPVADARLTLTGIDLLPSGLKP
jgi:hypothetical protein